MTIQIGNLSTLLPAQDGWDSLLSDMKRDQADLVTEIFLEYIGRIQDPDLCSVLPSDDSPYITEEKDRFLRSMMKDSVADLIMKYMIRNQKEPVKKLSSVLFLIPEGDSILEEIKVLFDRYSFDPYWKATQSVAEYDFGRRQWSYPGLNNLNEEKRGGLLSCWDKYALTRYRIIHRINVERAREGNSTWKKAAPEAFQYSCQAALETLNPSSPYFEAGAYFFTLLKHHDALISRIENLANLFFKKEEVNSSERAASELLTRRIRKVSVANRSESAPDLRRKKTSSSEESSSLSQTPSYERFMQALLKRKNKNIISQFIHIKNCLEETNFFPNPAEIILGAAPPLQPENPRTDKMDETEDCDKLSGYVQGFEQRLLSAPLSHSQVLELIPFLLEEAESRGKESPTALLKQLTKLAKDLFQLPLDNSHYQPLLKTIALHVHQATEKQMVQFDIQKIRKTQVWDQLFKGKASMDSIDVIIYELTCETARQFCMLDPRDLNSHIPKFLNQELPPELSLEVIDSKLENQPAFKIQSLLNNLIYFVGYKILSVDSKKGVRKARSACLQLAGRMLEMAVINLHLLMALHLALNQIPISRLDDTEVGPLSLKEREVLLKLNQLCDPKSNFKSLREAITQWVNPSLPFLGMLKGDFEHAVQTNDEEAILLQKPVVLVLLEKFFKTQSLIKATVPFKQQDSQVLPCVYAAGKGKTSEEILQELDDLSRKKWPRNIS